MFDIGWTELLLIGIVALIVVGPKDLPVMFRTLGQFTGKLRGMAREFQRAMDDAARESGASDLAKDLKTMTSAKNLGLDAVKDATKRLDSWDQTKRAAKAEDKPMGPATKALAEAQAAKKAERAEKAASGIKPETAASKKPAAKPKAAAKPKTDAKATTPAKAKTPAKPAPAAKAKTAAAPAKAAKPATKKPAAKPRAKKTSDA